MSKDIINNDKEEQHKYHVIQLDDNEANPLRLENQSVASAEFGSEELLSFIKNMKSEATKDHDGVAIAAPQLGVNKKIFVIAERSYKDGQKWKPEVFINPEIVDSSKKMVTVHEGCLSVRGIYGSTDRYKNITVNAYDEMGNKFTYGAGGLIAHIIQHEYDHLDGILFIDHGYELEEYDHTKAPPHQHE